MEGEQHILTAEEVGKLLKMSRSSVYKMREQGFLPARYKWPMGEKGWRWCLEDVDAFRMRYKIFEPPQHEAAPKFVPLERPARRTGS
jgi:predicted DNA-binding transcriptional regulator AlpA